MQRTAGHDGRDRCGSVHCAGLGDVGREGAALGGLLLKQVVGRLLLVVCGIGLSGGVDEQEMLLCLGGGLLQQQVLLAGSGVNGQEVLLGGGIALPCEQLLLGGIRMLLEQKVMSPGGCSHEQMRASALRLCEQQLVMRGGRLRIEQQEVVLRSGRILQEEVMMCAGCGHAQEMMR